MHSLWIQDPPGQELQPAPFALPMKVPGNMRAQHRSPALAAALLLLLLAIVAADEPLASPDPTHPASGQTPEPVANAEPILPGKAEASGESEMATPLEQLTTGMPPVSFAGADRSHTDDTDGGLLNSDASNMGSFSLDLLPGETQSGPAMDTPAHSHESQESLGHDMDSEESLASQGV